MSARFTVRSLGISIMICPAGSKAAGIRINAWQNQFLTRPVRLEFPARPRQFFPVALGGPARRPSVF
jgi:hypothetical protein